MKRGCAIVAILAVLGLLALFCWPYRLDTIESSVSRNQTGCHIDTTSHGGWKSRSIGPGIEAEEVAYPLEIYVFVTACPAVPNGRPYAAELVSVTSGKVVAHGLACANAPEEDLPCRLQMPPVASLAGADRYVVRVLGAHGAPVRRADLRLYVSHAWRSVVLDRVGGV
ncbi:MAG: hypothetical protein V4475_16740 [Pseudomonadota bacterium]